MTQTIAAPAEPDAGRASRFERWGRWVVAGVVLTVTAAVLGAVWGTRQTGVHTEVVTCYSQQSISCDLADGWTVGVSKDLPWTDVEGTFHEKGRPACLPPGGVTDPVRLHWVEAASDGTEWRSVVAVTCLS
jgi:hypothetical protein